MKFVNFKLGERTIQIKTKEMQPQIEIPVDIAIRIIKPMLDDPFRKYFIRPLTTIMKTEWVHVKKIDGNISIEDLLDFLIFLIDCYHYYALITQSESIWKSSAWKNLSRSRMPIRYAC